MHGTSSELTSNVGRPVKIHIRQLCAETGGSLEDLQREVADWDRERERGGGFMLSARLDDVQFYSLHSHCDEQMFLVFFLHINKQINKCPGAELFYI